MYIFVYGLMHHIVWIYKQYVIPFMRHVDILLYTYVHVSTYHRYVLIVGVGRRL